jgi:hypothetical protein
MRLSVKNSFETLKLSQKISDSLSGIIHIFDMEGNYTQLGELSPLFTGNFEIDDKGKLAGRIIDYSGFPRLYAVEGHVVEKDSDVEMTFAKARKNEKSVYYGLKKCSGSSIKTSPLEGEYRGIWDFDIESLEKRMKAINEHGEPIEYIIGQYGIPYAFDEEKNDSTILPGQKLLDSAVLHLSRKDIIRLQATV